MGIERRRAERGREVSWVGQIGSSERVKAGRLKEGTRRKVRTDRSGLIDGGRSLTAEVENRRNSLQKPGAATGPDRGLRYRVY